MTLGNDRQRPSATIGNGHRQEHRQKIGNGHRQRLAAVVSGSAAIGWALSAARPSKAGVDDAARGHLDDRIEAQDVGLDAAGPARIGEPHAERHNRCPQQKSTTRATCAIRLCIVHERDAAVTIAC